MMIANTPASIGRLVERYLHDRSGLASEVHVVHEDVHLADSRDEWWWVPVTFDADPNRRRAFYELLADIEEEIEQNNRLYVLLLPRPVAQENSQNGA